MNLLKMAVVASVSLIWAGCATESSAKVPAKISTFAVHVYEVMEKEGWSLQQTVDAFKAAGVTGFDGEYTDPRLEELVAAGLEPVMVYGFMCFRDPKKGPVEAEKYLSRARKLGAKFMMIMPDSMKDLRDNPRDEEYARALTTVIAGLRTLAKKALAAGITPMVEDVGWRFYPGSHFYNMKRFFAEVPELRFAIDTGNVMFADRGEDVQDFNKAFHDRICHVHVKDHPAGRPQAYAPLGEGVVPNGQILRELFAEGYNGWVTLELFDAPDMKNAVPKAAAFVNACK